MLMNGKKVNHLVINGESFTSNGFFPKQYKVTAGSAKCYYNLQIDNNGKPVFSEAKIKSDSGGWLYYGANFTTMKNIVIISQIITSGEEEYALTYCLANLPAVSNLISVWIKVSDFGGMTPVDSVGGVNSPSYLPFIYYCAVLLVLGVLLPC